MTNPPSYSVLTLTWQGALAAGVLALGAVGTAQATLVSRLGGQAYYDDVLDITWLADANYGGDVGLRRGERGEQR